MTIVLNFTSSRLSSVQALKIERYRRYKFSTIYEVFCCSIVWVTTRDSFATEDIIITN